MIVAIALTRNDCQNSESGSMHDIFIIDTLKLPVENAFEISLKEKLESGASYISIDVNFDEAALSVSRYSDDDDDVDLLDVEGILSQAVVELPVAVERQLELEIFDF